MYLEVTYSDVTVKRITDADRSGRITSHLVLLGMELPDEHGSSLHVTNVAPTPTLSPPNQPSCLVEVLSDETERAYSVWFKTDYQWLIDVRTSDCRYPWRIDSFRQDGSKALRGYNRHRNNSELAHALLSAEAFPEGISPLNWTVQDAICLPGNESQLLFWFGLVPQGGCSSTCSECDIDDPKQVINCIPWLLPAERDAIRNWVSINFKDDIPIVVTRDPD